MGEVEISGRHIIIHSVCFFYGSAASADLSKQVAADIARHWNEPAATIKLANNYYRVIFNITGVFAPALQPLDVISNTNPRNNFFRIESFAGGNISFVDAVGSNTGYFKLDNLLNHSTTAAHEYGHTIGLDHPRILDIRGRGVPGIMYPRGTIVDPAFQYSPVAKPLEPGGTINPFTRKVLPQDIDNLRISKLRFSKSGTAILGAFSSVWHDAHVL